jgi:hypothetical protein
LVRNDSSKLLLTLLALIVTLPVAIFAVASLVSQLPDFFNPCLTWGMPNPGTISVSSAGPCSTAGGISETIPQAVLRLALVQGGILIAIGLGMVGFLRSRSKLLTAGSVILCAESVLFVVDGLFVLTLPPAIFLMWVARRQLPRQRGLEKVNSVQPKRIGKKWSWWLGR